MISLSCNSNDLLLYISARLIFLALKPKILFLVTENAVSTPNSVRTSWVFLKLNPFEMLAIFVCDSLLTKILLPMHAEQSLAALLTV